MSWHIFVDTNTMADSKKKLSSMLAFFSLSLRSRFALWSILNFFDFKLKLAFFSFYLWTTDEYQLIKKINQTAETAINGWL